MAGEIAVHKQAFAFRKRGQAHYRGTVFTGLPIMAWVFGYLRSSWTLKVTLLDDFVCRLLNHSAATWTRVVTLQLRDAVQDMALELKAEAEKFNSGYLQRDMHLLPQQGYAEPRKLETDYSMACNQFDEQ